MFGANQKGSCTNIAEDPLKPNNLIVKKPEIGKRTYWTDWINIKILDQKIMGI